MDIPLNKGGGFGSKLQLAASKALRALRHGRAFRFVGHFGRYTNNSVCLQQQGATSFEESGWPCFLAEAQPRRRRMPCRRVALTARSLLALLWRPNELLQRRFAELAKEIGFVPTRTLLAVQIRRGDKITNPFNRYHAASEYVRELLHAARGAGLCDALVDATGDSQDGLCQLFVASDSAAAFQEVRQFVDSLGDGSQAIEVIGLFGSETQGRSAVGVEIARAMEGDSRAFAIANEVLFDLEMLSRSRIFVGTLASQVTRVAASIGFAQGTMSQVVALDFDVLPEVQAVFDQFGMRVDDIPWMAPVLSG